MKARFFRIRRTGEWGVELLFPASDEVHASEYRTKGREYMVAVDRANGDVVDVKVTPFSFRRVKRRDADFHLYDALRIGCRIIRTEREQAEAFGASIFNEIMNSDNDGCLNVFDDPGLE